MRTIIKNGLPFIGNVLKLLPKSILIPLQLTAVASATDASIHKKTFGSGFTKLIISNEEMNDIMKMVYKVLIDSNVSHHEFVLINNVLKESDDMKGEITNSNDK